MGKRRSLRRTPGAGTLPVAALHYLCTGVELMQAEGVALYGPTFAWVDAYVPELHPREIAATREKHHDEIEAHRRRYGLPNNDEGDDE